METRLNNSLYKIYLQLYIMNNRSELILSDDNTLFVQLLTLPVMVKLAVALLCGLLPYIYLPVAAHMRIARWTWGDQRTFVGFLTHLLRVEYGTWDLVSDRLSIYLR